MGVVHIESPVGTAGGLEKPCGNLHECSGGAEDVLSSQDLQPSAGPTSPEVIKLGTRSGCRPCRHHSRHRRVGLAPLFHFRHCIPRPPSSLLRTKREPGIRRSGVLKVCVDAIHRFHHPPSSSCCFSAGRGSPFCRTLYCTVLAIGCSEGPVRCAARRGDA